MKRGHYIPCQTPHRVWRERHWYSVVCIASRHPPHFFVFSVEGSASPGTLRSGLFSCHHHLSLLTSGRSPGTGASFIRSAILWCRVWTMSHATQSTPARATCLLHPRPDREIQPP